LQINLGERIFVISAAAALCGGGAVREGRVYQVGLVDEFKSGDRIRVCREALEAKMARASIGRSRILLVDGSLVANLAAEPRFSAAIPGYRQSLSRSLWREAVRELIEASGREGLRVITADPRRKEELLEAGARILSLEGGNPYEDRRLYMLLSMMERVEQAASILTLLREGEERGIPIASVSKTSSSRMALCSERPDLVEIQARTREPGYLRPRPVSLPLTGVVREVARELGVEESVEYVLTYARLARGAAPLKIEIFGAREGEVEDLLEALGSSSVSGYPYPLRRAHELSVVSRRDLEAVVRMLELARAESGREALGVVW
ncbi:MAG: hypothetical protein DRO06_03350, partial [Thermoproteota archaeon]